MGEDVRVSGSCPSLGCEDPNRAVPLYTTPQKYPMWSNTESIFVPGSNQGTYRYCVFSGGVFKRWEGEADELLRRQFQNNGSQREVVTADALDEVAPPPGVIESEKSDVLAPGPIIKKSKTFFRQQLKAWMQKEGDQNISQMDGVIIVACFLPVIVNKETSGKWVVDWDTENLLSFQTSLRVSWIGLVRHPGIETASDKRAITDALSELRCYPIFIDQTRFHDFYNVFCKQTLWPVLHHVAGVYSTTIIGQNDKNEADIWRNYMLVNKMFRDKVVEAYHNGDLIWVHGFHLMLLPSILRRDIPNCKIGMFFHTPFPSSELWLTLARREDLLRGILNADQVGFHLFEYARHFLSTCKRVVGSSNDMNASGVMTLSVDGRQVTVSCIHIGVDLPRVEKAIADPTVEVNVLRWRNTFAGKIVIAGIDRLERIKGIPLKLSAIEMFAERCPEWREKVVFAMIGISAEERHSDYRETQKEVRYLIHRINRKYPGLVAFEERRESDMGLKERLEFFAAADILLVIPPRDGLNRMPIEFTLARHRLGYILGGPPAPSTRQRTMTEGSVTGIGTHTGSKNSEGLVIISEFVSTGRVMRGAMIVNPWRFDEVVDTLKRALEMDSSERTLRMRKNVEFSSRLTTLHWAYHVLQDLKKIKKSDDIERSTMIGLGSTYRYIGIKSGFHQLDFAEIAKFYKTSTSRLILLDWGGTLVDENDKLDTLQAYAVAQGHASRVGPSEQLKQVLELLCADPKNTLFVVSGKKLEAVTEFFGNVAGIGLAAEHGSFFRMPQRPGGRMHHWQTAMGLSDQSWKEPAKMVMDNYTVRTHGTYVEQKGNALIWQYRDADPEFGFAQSKELEDNLQDILSGYPVNIIRGGGVSDGYIEVRPVGVSKGHFLVHVMDLLKNMRLKVDFVMCIGDDSSDEPMFQMLRQLPTKGVLMSKYGVAVGKKPTAATSYVDDSSQVMQLLTMLGKCTNQMNRRYMSVVNLSSQGLMTAPCSPHSRLNKQTNSGGLGAMNKGMSMNNLHSSTSFESEVLY